MRLLDSARMAARDDERRALARCIEHTLLAPGVEDAAVLRLCAEAREHGFGAVMVAGVHVALCAAALAESDVAVGSVVGFPLGSATAEVKAFEAARALEAGAAEIDMVLDLGALRSGREGDAGADVAAVAARVHAAGGRLKVILETGLLTEPQTRLAARIAEEAGADFLKTSTGFGPRGATVEDVLLLRDAARLPVKAAGGIRTLGAARALLEAGAARLGSSSSVAILSEL